VVNFEDAACDALVEGGHILLRDFELHILLAWTFEHGGGMYDLLRVPRQPGDPDEDRIPDRLRHANSVRRDHFADEERVPSGCPMECVRIDVRVFDQQLDRLDRQGRYAELEDPLGGHVAKRKPKWVSVSDLLFAKGADQEHGQLPKAPADDAQEVERSLVRPVQIVDDNDSPGRPVAQHVQKRRQDPIAAATVQIRLQAVYLRRDIDDRREGAGWDDRVARTPKRRGRRLAAKGFDQRRLADSRFTDNEDQPPIRTCFRKVRREALEQSATLQKRHRSASYSREHQASEQFKTL
jgi:hypothetical protein